MSISASRVSILKWQNEFSCHHLLSTEAKQMIACISHLMKGVEGDKCLNSGRNDLSLRSNEGEREKKHLTVMQARYRQTDARNQANQQWLIEKTGLVDLLNV